MHVLLTYLLTYLVAARLGQRQRSLSVNILACCKKILLILKLSFKITTRKL